MECMPCRFIPRYNAQTEEAEFLRGGEADVADNRLPEQELAELGQSHGSHSNGPSHSANAVHPHPRSSKTSLGVQQLHLAQLMRWLAGSQATRPGADVHCWQPQKELRSQPESVPCVCQC